MPLETEIRFPDWGGSEIPFLVSGYVKEAGSRVGILVDGTKMAEGGWKASEGQSEWRRTLAVSTGGVCGRRVPWGLGVNWCLGTSGKAFVWSQLWQQNPDCRGLSHRVGNEELERTFLGITISKCS